MRTIRSRACAVLLVAASCQLPWVADDEPGDVEWLRRVSLDMVGKLPTMEELRAFLDDPSPDKRERLIEAILEDPGFGGLPIGKLKRRWTGAGFLEAGWQAYVEAFGAHYRLDEARFARAAEMLRLARQDAAEYRKAREREFRELADLAGKLGEAEAAAESASDRLRLAGERRKLESRGDELERPLSHIFDLLREALDALPTAEQKRRAGRFTPPK